MGKLTKYLIILLLLLGSSDSYGQRRKKPQNLIQYDFQKLHFGFTLGMNELNFNIKKNSNIITNDTLLSLLSSSQKGFTLELFLTLESGSIQIYASFLL